MTVRKSTGAVASTASGEVRSAYGRWHDPETVVCWASGSKVFLAALARHLVATSALAWETPVGELVGVQAPPAMTIAALVEHRSGLPRALPEQKSTLPDPYAGWTTERFDERVLADLSGLAGLGTPGGVAYSNVGYAVLARAIEVSQDRGWLELVREHVVQPLGLPGGLLLVARPEAASSDGPFALGARDLRNRPVGEWDVSVGPFAASGGLCSTVPDMARILRAALDARSVLIPDDAPHAWEQHGPRAWHAGALFRSGSLLVVDSETGAVAASHAVGGLPGHGARHAEQALDALLSDIQPKAPVGGGQ